MNNKTFVQMFGFDHPAASLSQAVVIVIDMQREYLDGSVPLPDLQATLKGAADLLSIARLHKTPIIHVLNQGPKGNLLFNAEGPYYAELAEVAAIEGEATVIKHLPNSFAGTNLQVLVDATGRKQLIIAGCTTHVIVEQPKPLDININFTGHLDLVIHDARENLEQITGEKPTNVVRPEDIGLLLRGCLMILALWTGKSPGPRQQFRP